MSVQNKETAIYLIETVIKYGKHSVSLNCLRGMLYIARVPTINNEGGLHFEYEDKYYKIVSHGDSHLECIEDSSLADKFKKKKSSTTGCA